MLSLCTPAPPGQGRAFPADTGEKKGYSLSKLLKLLSMLLSGQGSAWILPELSVRQGQERPHGTWGKMQVPHLQINTTAFFQLLLAGAQNLIQAQISIFRFLILNDLTILRKAEAS